MLGCGMIAVSGPRILGFPPDESVSETGMDLQWPFHAECPTWICWNRDELQTPTYGFGVHRF